MTDGEGGNFLCRIWDGSIHRPGLDSVGFRYADGAILPGGPTYKSPKDRGDGMPALPGGRGAGRQGLQPEDYWRR